jgi:hypothetical protein
VRPESFTQIYGRTAGSLTRVAPTECQPTMDELEVDSDEETTDETPNLTRKEVELIQKLANKHYYR